MLKTTLSSVLCLIVIANHFSNGFPTGNDEYRFIERDYASPGAHQLASWLAYQLRPKEFIPPMEVPVIPYRLPLHNGKRNSEVTNAMINSEETQKMYRDGRK
ncbi:uncharacterized protein LOC109545554 [Dendroctonus ponderosae]